MEALPKCLLSYDVLDDLCELLSKKEKYRFSLQKGNYGSPVTDENEARNLLHKIIRVTGEILHLDAADIPEPQIILTRRMSKLPRQILRLYIIFIPLVLFFLYLTMQYEDGGFDVWFIRIIIFFLLLFPLIFRKRMRLNIEHDAGYVRYGDGLMTIMIDQLPSVQFQSFLAHEYAHHIYYHSFGDVGEPWMKEGWARLVQWKVVQHLYRTEKNPAYLFHVLNQIIGELKFVCMLICRIFHMSVPRRIRRIKTMYRGNLLINFFTGNPGFDPESLIEHGVGTVYYFLAERRMGLHEALWSSGLRNVSGFEDGP